MGAGRAGAKNEMTSVARKQLDRPRGPPPFASAAAVPAFDSVQCPVKFFNFRRRPFKPYAAMLLSFLS